MTVCILAAGFSRRVGDYSDYVNKAILPVGSKAVLSHIIDKFPLTTKFVIAVGHRSESIVDYTRLAYPHRNVTFVDVEHYVGEGAGPATSLLECRDHLQCPFILTTADTIVTDDIPAPDTNWFGIAPVQNTEDYCTVAFEGDRIIRIDDKVKSENRYAFIGLAGIKDHERFFLALQLNKETIQGEVQLSNGFDALLPELTARHFTWFDTGNLAGYEAAITHFAPSGYDFTKTDEFIYFVDDRVIKFFGDKQVTRNRVSRASLLGDLVPALLGSRGHFFVYPLVPGETLYSKLTKTLVKEFYAWLGERLWKPIDLADDARFRRLCEHFYHQKTLERVRTFYRKTCIQDVPTVVNGVDVPPLRQLLERVDWESLYRGVPCIFHGDLNFGNVLVTEDDRRFILLDWRQDFGGAVDVGDMYYDLGKLYAGLTVSFERVKEGDFSFEKTDGTVTFELPRDQTLEECRAEYEIFLERYDKQKVRVLRALIFLNMSPLHNPPFDELCYYLGQMLLYEALQTGAPHIYTKVEPLDLAILAVDHLPRLCIGPMSKTVVDTIISYAAHRNVPINIVASRSQVETEALGGGYVNNWTTEDFAGYVKAALAVTPADVLLCRDHGGPWLGKDEKGLSERYAMLSAKASFEADIAGGFALIHIDTSFFPDGVSDMDVALERAFSLLMFCEEKARQYNNSVQYEVGTEDADGGIVNPKQFESFLGKICSFCADHQIVSPTYIVGRTGTFVREATQDGCFDFDNTVALVTIAAKYGVGIKEHNVDYEAPERLSLRRKSNVAAVNVAPEFGVVETTAILDFCERQKRRDLRERFLDLAYESKRWRKWLREPDTSTKEAKAIMAGHYVFGTPAFVEIKEELGPALEGYCRQAIWKKLDWYVRSLYQ